MQTTNNLGLKKPGAEDVVNIEDLNSNSDVLDGKFGTSSGHGHTGVAGDGPKIGSSGLAAGAATDTVIGSRTVSDATAPTGDSGTPTTLFGWLANMIKAITGGATWRTLPGMTIAAIKTILDAATNAGTASTLMKRDANGRAQVSGPLATGDIANKGYVDTAVSGATIADASLTVKGKVQLSSATNSTSEVMAATPKAVKDAYDRGSAGVTAAATAQSTANAVQTRANNALPKDGSEPMTAPLTINRQGGVEGGELRLQAPATTSLSAPEVAIDIANNHFRVFENGGSYRGFQVDLTQMTNLATLWTSANDGAGSGSDADMLDGIHASLDFVPTHYIPVVNEHGGTLEIGRYIDFHKNGSTNDFDTRIAIDDDNNIWIAPFNQSGWGLRNSGGILEANTDGEWKPVGGAAITVASNILRGQNMSEYSSLPYAYYGLGVLVYKFVPRGTGEVVLTADMQVARYYNGDDYEDSYVQLRTYSPDVNNTSKTVDYRTPLGTKVAVNGDEGTTKVIAHRHSYPANAGYQTVGTTIHVKDGVPVYVFASVTGSAPGSVRNVQIYYDFA